MSNEVFGKHAFEIFDDPKFKRFSCIDTDKPENGIVAVGPDRAGYVRTIKIIPSDNYPNTPPVDGRSRYAAEKKLK